MTGTVNARYHLPENRPRVSPIMRIVAVYLVALVTTVSLIAWAVGVRDEYQGMAVKLLAAERRADTLQKQLDLMLKHGDGGILIANISPDIGPCELRLVPAGRRASR